MIAIVTTLSITNLLTLTLWLISRQELWMESCFHSDEAHRMHQRILEGREDRNALSKLLQSERETHAEFVEKIGGLYDTGLTGIMDRFDESDDDDDEDDDDQQDANQAFIGPWIF